METQLTAVQNLINTGISFVVAYGFQIIGAIIILIIGFQLAKWLGRVVASLCERQHLDITLARFFGAVTKTLVLTFVIVIALAKFGITIAPFIAAIGAVAFGATLAIQGPLSNYGAGIAIILGRPFTVGNTITVCDVSGVVEEVTLGATLLSTEDGEAITIPNKQILGEVLCNSFAHKVVETSIGISYGDDPGRAIEVIRVSLGEVPNVTTDPPPQIGIVRFGDSAIEIGLRYWVPTKSYFQTLYGANHAIYNALKGAGVTIPYPKLELHVQKQPNAAA